MPFTPSMMRRAITSRWGIGGLGTLASRPEEPDPGLIEGRRAYGNGFGIEGRRGPDQTGNAGHPRIPTRKRLAGAARSQQRPICWLRRFNSPGKRGSACLLIGHITAPRFLHPLRGEQAQQGQRNNPLPAERTPSLHRDIQHFWIDQRPYPLSPRRPFQDGLLANPTTRKGGYSGAYDRNQQPQQNF
jgi:hypothetical protein